MTRAVSSQIQDDEGTSSVLYKSVLQDLCARIERREVMPGEKLPSINALCGEYGVSNITVRAAIKELVSSGYVESRPRSGLFVRERPGGGRNFLLRQAVAVLSPYVDDPDPSHVQSGWLHHITQGAVHEIRRSGLHAITLHPDLLVGEELEQFVEAQPQVVVLTDRHHARDFPRTVHVIEELHQRGVRMAVYGGGPELVDYDCVISDHEAGAHQLTRWLIRRGHRRIINIWPTDAAGYWYPYRFAGYEQAMQEAGLKPVPALRVLEEPTYGNNEAEFRRSVRHLSGHLIEHLSRKGATDAILVHTDADVFRVAAACRLFGKEPNQDIAIVGYDNIWADCVERRWESSQPLATVDKRNREIGKALVLLLLQRRAGHLPPEPQSRVVEPVMLVSNVVQK